MLRYVLLVRNNPFGSRLMLNSGAEGAAGLEEAVKAFGGELVNHYIVSGRVNAVYVVDFPSDAACVAFEHSAGSWGQSVEAMRCHPASLLDDARKLAYQATEALTKQLQEQRANPS